MPKERTGLLIIRAWLEEGSSAPLRAQVSTSSDVSIGIEHKSTHSDVADVSAEVQTWLKGIVDDS